jgi:hypothetical protein
LRPPLARPSPLPLRSQCGRLEEKAYNRWINNWLRGPGCVTASAFIYCNWALGHFKDSTPTPVVFVAMLLIMANGQYYSERVIANHAQVGEGGGGGRVARSRWHVQSLAQGTLHTAICDHAVDLGPRQCEG